MVINKWFRKFSNLFKWRWVRIFLYLGTCLFWLLIDIRIIAIAHDMQGSGQENQLKMVDGRFWISKIKFDPYGNELSLEDNNDIWIDIDLSSQILTVFENENQVTQMLISSGTKYTPTIIGVFRVYEKHEETTMDGPGYYLTDVKYVMYFYKGYSIHGTYWHDQFGVPMSHGCINITEEEAEWLYGLVGIGTMINIHY